MTSVYNDIKNILYKLTEEYPSNPLYNAQNNNPMDIDKMDIDKMDIDKMDIDKMDIDKMDIDKMDIDEMDTISTELDNKTIYIDGPMNIISVFNKQYDINITAIADYHEDVSNQSRCKKNESYDLVGFIKYKLKKATTLDDTLHMFIETCPENHTIHNNMPIEKMRYADKVINFCVENFTMLYNSNEITKTSSEYPNVILHFVDIRNVMFINMDNYFIKLTTLESKLTFSSLTNNKMLSEIEQVLTSINGMMKFTYDVFFNSKYEKSEDLKEKYTKLSTETDPNKELISSIIIKIIIQKIKHSYNNIEIKNKMNQYINGELKTNFDLFFIKYEEIIKLLKTLVDKNDKDKTNAQFQDGDGGVIYGRPYINLLNDKCKLDVLLYEFNQLWFVELTSKIMDIYMLRIILNSNVKYGLVFTGIEHTMFLIYFLVKYFDFSIDKASLLNDITYEELTDKIKNGNSKEFHKYLFPKIFEQCSTNEGFTSF
jgi:hypothetical protein